MADLDYKQLTHAQRLALFLIVIGPDAAAAVLRGFEDADAGAVCREMAQITVVPDHLQREAVAEFSEIISQNSAAVAGGLAYAHRTLGAAKGLYKANAVLGPVDEPTGDANEVIERVNEMSAAQLFNLIKREQPQTVAFVLSCLDCGKAADVVALLSPELRDEVIERLGTIDATSGHLVNKIIRQLAERLPPKAQSNSRVTGGARAVANLLNRLDKEMSRNILTRLSDRNAELGVAIRKKMFSFEDLNRFQAVDLQRVLREVETNTLALAMKSASQGLREKIFGVLPKRAAEGLRDEIQMTGAVRLRDVEAAQDSVLQAVRHLEEEGQISLDNDGAAMTVQ
jgi:flagellar motor switch protein FliG